MINISGYTIKELISKNTKSTIYRGIRDADGTSIVVKLLSNEYPSAEELVNSRREFKITNKSYGTNVIKAYATENYHNSIAIILEDFNGKSLAELLKTNKFNFTEKLTIAVEIIEGIRQIHKQRVIHKDINPTNIVYNLKTKQLKIIDFSLATELSNEKFQNLYVLEGSYAYMSPEQTGKMNRIIDYRTDLYSLGVTLYEIFTGQLPFKGDNLEMIHNHIAKVPAEPSKLNIEIPSTISDIIMKLLSKNAEDRYQTTTGLKYDLEYCLNHLQSKDRMKNYQIAHKDISDIFKIPQKLYGRKNELDQLKNFFNNPAKNPVRLLLVSGYSGIGKTSVIRELSQTIINRGGRFLSGKFDQLNRNNPCSAINTAFNGLIKNLLSDPQQLESWKKRLTQILGMNAKVITEMIPELEHIIGKPPEINQLNPVEERNRFQIVFKDFISAFTSRKNPLIIFLDDLQWSDFSTIDLLKYLLISDKIDNLFIIGAYRDNEVKKEHPLLIMLDEVKKTTGKTDCLFEFHLEPLTKQAVNELSAETLKRPNHETTELTDYLYQKTKGNPFFTNQLLKSLYENGVFKFNVEKRQWEWELDALQKTQMSDNVIDLLIQDMKQLPVKALELLKDASCIGSYFELQTLYYIIDDHRDIAEAIWLAIEKDYILPLDHHYKYLPIQKDQIVDPTIEIKFRFSHDRIQQTAYSLLSENDKILIHQKIGKYQLEVSKNDSTDNNRIFEITNHLNIARQLINNKDERRTLFELNYTAGMKAKNKTAYDIAKKYFSFGISLLSDNEWTEYSEQLFTLTLNYAESCFLSSEIDEAFKYCTEAYNLAKNNIEKATVYELKIKMLEHKGEKRGIILDEIRNGLKLVDIMIPADPQELEQQIGSYMGKMQANIAEITIEGLVNLPKMQDKMKITAMNLLFQALPVAFEYNMQVYMIIQLMMFDMAVRYGTTDVSSKNFVECGITQGLIMGNYEAGYKFGKVAFDLINKFKYDSLKSACSFIFATFISHYRQHYSESLEYFEIAIKSGLEVGDIQHPAYAHAHKIHFNIYFGKNLNECKAEIDHSARFLKSCNAILLFIYIENFSYMINQLQFPYNNESEKALTEKVLEDRIAFNIGIFGSINLILNYILGNIDAAEKWNNFTEPYLPGFGGHFSSVDHCLFQSLLLIKKYDQSLKPEQDEILNKLNKNVTVLKFWADNSPKNYSHKYYIVAAEMARIRHDALEIITGLYKKALDSIAPHEFMNIRAVINELIGDFYLSRDEEISGKAYIKEAYYFYSQWGAYAKTSLIEKKYAQFFTCSQLTNEIKIIPSSHQINAVNFDIMSILKSSQAISGEIKFDKLLKVLMYTVIENAGVQNGCLILKNILDGKFYIEAFKNQESDEVILMKSKPLNESIDCCLEIIYNVLRTKEMIVVDNAYQHPDYQNNSYIQKMKIKSILCMPIIYEKNLKGVIYLENNLIENLFIVPRIEILKILLSQIAISIENAHLMVHRENATRLQTTMQIAQDIQFALLPKNPFISGYEITAYMKPAELMGGDYYDVINTENKDWIIISDVSGHGISAGLVMIMLQACIHQTLNLYPKLTPSELLSIVNKTITKNSSKLGSDNEYITICVLASEEEGKFIFSGAHQDIIIYRMKEQSVELIPTNGMWLGIQDDISHLMTNEEFKLTPGDIMLIYTDGIIEAKKKTDETLFGLDLLKEILKKYGKQPIEVVKNKIISELQNYICNDDVAMLIVRKE